MAAPAAAPVISQADTDTFMDSLLSECRFMKSCVLTFSKAVAACGGDGTRAELIMQKLETDQRSYNPPGLTVGSDVQYILNWIQPGMLIGLSSAYYYIPEVFGVMSNDILMAKLESVRALADCRRYVALTKEIVLWLVKDWDQPMSLAYAFNYLISNSLMSLLTRVAADTADPNVRIFILSNRAAQVLDLTAAERTRLLDETAKFDAKLKMYRLSVARTSEDTVVASYSRGVFGDPASVVKERDARNEYIKTTGH